MKKYLFALIYLLILQTNTNPMQQNQITPAPGSFMRQTSTLIKFHSAQLREQLSSIKQEIPDQAFRAACWSALTANLVIGAAQWPSPYTYFAAAGAAFSTYKLFESITKAPSQYYVSCAQKELAAIESLAGTTR
jgi:hypothetical protein